MRGESVELFTELDVLAGPEIADIHRVGVVEDRTDQALVVADLLGV